jgi:hypothetical protein
MEVDKIMRALLTLGATRALHEDMEVDKIMRTLLTLETNSSTPRRHGGGQNLRGVLEFAPSVSNVLIIFSTSMSSWIARVAPSVSNALIILSTSMSSWSARICP